MLFQRVPLATLPEHTKDWYRAGPFGDSLDDIAAFERIALEMQESCGDEAFFGAHDSDDTAWVIVRPDDAEAMRVIGKMMKAYLDNELLEEDDFLAVFDDLCFAQWRNMALPSRLDLVRSCGLAVADAMKDTPAEPVWQQIADIVEAKHPLYGC